MDKRLAYLICLLVLLHACGKKQKSKTDIPTVLCQNVNARDSIINAYKYGDFSKILLYDSLCMSDLPFTDTLVWVYKLDARIEVGDYTNALVVLNKLSLKKIIDTPDFYYYKSRITQKTSYIDTAILYEKNKDKFYIYRGSLMLDSNKYLSAEQDFCKAISINGNYLHIAFGYMGYLHMINAKYDSAQIYYRKALSIDTNSSRMYYNYALCKYHIQEVDSSLELFSRSISLRDNDPEVYYERGKIYYSLNDKAKACEDWEKAKNLNLKLAEKLIDRFCM